MPKDQSQDPGFWSHENFPYAPLLALGQTIPRGYQYQSQLTPYKRDARGDWGRALNESINQFFGMYPQFLQQKRQFALQRDQLARQRTEDLHRAKLRPYELKEAAAGEQLRQRQMQMREDYPEMVKGLPISEDQKTFLLGQSPEAGNQILKAWGAKMMQPKMITLGVNDPKNKFGVPVQVNPTTGKITPIKVPQQVITLPVGHEENPYNVPVEYNPVTKQFSFPLERPHTELQTLDVGHKDNPFKVKAQFNPKTKKVTPINVTQELETLDVGHKDNPFKVKAQIHPLTKEVTPLNITQELKTLPVGHEENPYNVPVQVHPLTGKVTPINVPQKVNLLPVGHAGNPYNVPVEYNPTTNEYSFPLDRPHAEFETVQPEGKFPDGTFNNTKLPIQFDKKTGKRIAYAGTAPPKKIERATKDHPQVVALKNQFGEEYVNKMLPFLTVDKTYSETGELQFSKGMETLNKELQEKAIAAKAPTPSQLFETKHAESNYANVKSYADLAEVAGNRIESQKNFALTTLPETHPLRQRAQDDYNRRFVEMGPNGVLISEGHKKDYNQPGKPAFTSKAPKTIPVMPGDTLDQIVADFKAKGITVDPTQVIAANKHFFLDEQGFLDPNKMLTSAQVGGAEMIIPVGGGSLDDFQIGEAHRSDSPIGSARQRTIVMPGIGTVHAFKNATIKEELALNKELGQMKILQSNADEMLALLYDKEARNWFKLGSEARGKVNAIRWRLVNNIQTLREFGVLTPGEILVIEESIPNMNSFLNLIASDFKGLKGGSEKFIKGALGALKSEAKTKENQIRAYMKGYAIPELGFEIDVYNTPSSVDQDQGRNVEEQLTNELSTFE